MTLARSGIVSCLHPMAVQHLRQLRREDA